MKRVIVIEDHTAVRQMICQLVESIPGGDVPNLVKTQGGEIMC